MLLFLKIQKRFVFSLPVVLFIPCIAISQPDTLWTGTYGELDTDVITCTRQTTDGGFISTGYSSVDRNDFTQSNRDVWLFKTDSQGDLQWTLLYGFADNDTGNWVEQTSDGGFIMGGVIRVASLGSDHTSDDRLFAMKTDENGEQEWLYTYDNPSGPSVCTCVQETFDGGYIVLGAFENDVTTDVALIKLDQQGQEEWIRNYNGTPEYYDTPHFVEQTPDSGYIITGYYANVWTWEESSLFLMKIDEAGEEEWTRYYGSDGYDIGYCVHHLDGNGYIVVGSYWHWDTEQDLWLLRTDDMGNQVWSKRFGGDDNEYGHNVEVTADNYLFATGFTASMGAGGKDVYAVKVDFTGELIWQATFGGAGNDVGSCGQQLNGIDGYIIGGYTYSFSGNDDSDGWLIRLNSDLGIETSQADSDPSLSTFPSPFSSTLNIDLFLPSSADISVEIFDSTGRLIDTVFKGEIQQGTSSLQWTAPESAPSGCYLVHLQSEAHSTTRNCILLR